MSLTNFYSYVPTTINGRLPAMELLLVASCLVSWWLEGSVGLQTGWVAQSGLHCAWETILGLVLC